MVRPLFSKGGTPKKPATSGVFGAARRELPPEVEAVLSTMNPDEQARTWSLAELSLTGKLDAERECDRLIQQWKAYERNVNELSTKLSGLGVQGWIAKYVSLHRWRSRLSLALRIRPVRAWFEAEMSGASFAIGAGMKETESVKEKVKNLRSMVERLDAQTDNLVKALRVLSAMGRVTGTLEDRARHLDHCSVSLKLLNQQMDAVDHSVRSLEAMRRDIAVYL